MVLPSLLAQPQALGPSGKEVEKPYIAHRDMTQGGAWFGATPDGRWARERAARHARGAAAEMAQRADAMREERFGGSDDD
eukprot:gene48379-59568_t